MAGRPDRLLVDAVPGGRGVDRVKAALEAGGVVGIPTDTVYGLAVLPDQPGAVDRLFELKSRPDSIAVAVLVTDLAQAAQVLQMTPGIRGLAERFWPGALTIVGHRHPGVDYALGGDEASIGVRCPDAPYVRELCRRVGPLAVTSANRHGSPPLTEVSQLRASFGPQLLLVDGGTCNGAPSTVIDVRGSEVRCLREGAIAFQETVDCFCSAGDGEA